MFLRVNGLFGWVRTNDRRSIALFGGFVAALNVAAMLALYLPLAAFDPDHAPIFAWGGYLSRYVPLVTLAAAVVFGLQMLWHVKAVQRLVAFDFVDDADEPRLCRIVEPLAIGMGLPLPSVGVIDTPALNAFACGIGRANAVVVVTRGLIDGLDDDELAAVVAHELAHIANGDIRLLAAANACLRMIGWLVRARVRRGNRIQELIGLPIVILALPPLFLFILAVNFAAQSALKGSHLVRLLITSSREFIADATAVEATQNPAALVSALQAIEGRSRLADMPPGQDAMMIDGSCEGAFATHPTIAQRLAAITAVTGSMALIAPARRDTRARAPALPERGRRVSVLGVSLQTPASQAGAPPRDGTHDTLNWLGLTPTMTVGAVLALMVFAGVHRQDMLNPVALAAVLDPRPSNSFMEVVARGMACNVAALGSATLGTGKPDRCAGTAMHDFMVAQAKVSGPIGDLLASMTQAPEGEYVWPDGHFSNRPPPEVEAAQVRDNRCFRTQPYGPGRDGLRRVDQKPDSSGAFDIQRWLTRTASLAAAASAATTEQERDALLASYVTARKTNYETIHHFFGEPGLAAARQSFATPVHQQALTLLGDLLRDPRRAASFAPVQLAEATLLATSPDDFISCVARRAMVPESGGGVASGR